ncbi:unnamed protein product [Effrenium voratum]|uniref:Patched domain-containing protein 2 n=1 Tax=Effrenium voratum TaxID=2562239 RepID=A0AA36I809_9DINO|nr:unnamed protein product [Effrenium voratum]
MYLAWIAAGLAGLILFSYGASHAVHWQRKKRDARTEFFGPVELWLELLTRYPLLCLVAGVALPAAFGFCAFQEAGLPAVDLDFSGYLAADLPIQRSASVVQEAVRREEAKRGDRRRRAQQWAGWRFPSPNSSEEGALGRRLQTQSKPWRKLELFYQALDSRGIFTAEALEEIRQFEELVQSCNGYSEHCLLEDGRCKAPDSPTSLFFEPGLELKDINTTLRSLLRDGIYWFTDKDFNARNLTSQYTRATFQGGRPLAGYSVWQDRWSEQLRRHEDFLVELYEQVLRRADAGELAFEHVRFTWYEPSLQSYEVNKWLFHDALWCAGTFATVAILIMLNLQSIFLTLIGLLGVLLAFAATFYFHSVVMGYTSLTVLDFLSLFLIVGIAADDMFILCNTFYLAPAVLGDATPVECMKWAYKPAGEAMLVTTATTAGSFYANCASVLIVVKKFGFFMGTLVIWNYINVMIILPAAILVLEIYLWPLAACCQHGKRGPGQESLANVSETARESYSSRGGEIRISLDSKYSRAVPRVTATSLRTSFRSISSMADRAQSAVVRTLASRASVKVLIQRDIDEDQLNGLERFLHGPFHRLLTRSWACWLLLSMLISVLGAWMTVSSLTLAKGELRIFPETVNAGRLEALLTEVFSAESLDTEWAASSSTAVNPSTVSGNSSDCPVMADGAGADGADGADGGEVPCSGHGTCGATGACHCLPKFVGYACSVERRNATLQMDPEVNLVRTAEPTATHVPAWEMPEENIAWLSNVGDAALTWEAEVDVDWLALLDVGGSIGARRFNGTDVQISGQALRFLVRWAGRAVGWSGRAEVAIRAGSSEVRLQVTAAVLAPPTLSALAVRPFGHISPAGGLVVPPFTPSGWPNASYAVQVPYGTAQVELQMGVQAELQVLVDGQMLDSAFELSRNISLAAGASNVTVEVRSLRLNRSSVYWLGIERQAPEEPRAVQLQRAVAAHGEIEVTYALPAELPDGFQGVAASASSGILSATYAVTPCHPASCWDWNALEALPGGCCRMVLGNLSDGLWTFAVRAVGAAGPGAISRPEVGKGWPALRVASDPMAPSLRSPPVVVGHHGSVELLVSSQVEGDSGALPLGRLRCRSAPGEVLSEDSAFVAAANQWRAVVRGLDPNVEYTFACSISSSRSGTGASFASSYSPATSPVRPLVHPGTPSITFFRWAKGGLPEATLADTDLVRCSLGNQTVEGAGEVISFLPQDSEGFSLRCALQVCDLGLSEFCVWGEWTAADFPARPKAPKVEVKAEGTTLRVTLVSLGWHRCEVRTALEEVADLESSTETNTSTWLIEDLARGVYVVSCFVRHLGANFLLDSMPTYELVSLGSDEDLAAVDAVSVSAAGEGALLVTLDSQAGGYACRVDGGDEILGASTTQHVLVSGLIPGRSYSFDCLSLGSTLNGTAVYATRNATAVPTRKAAKRPEAPEILAVVPGDGELQILLLPPQSLEARGFAEITSLTCFNDLAESTVAPEGTSELPTATLLRLRAEGPAFRCAARSAAGAGRPREERASLGLPIVAGYRVKSVMKKQLRAHFADVLGLPLSVLTLHAEEHDQHLRSEHPQRRLAEEDVWIVQVVVPHDQDPTALPLAAKMDSPETTETLSRRLQTPVELVASARLWLADELDSRLKQLMVYEDNQQPAALLQWPSDEVHFVQVASSRFSVLGIPSSPKATVNAGNVFDISYPLPYMVNVSVMVIAADGTLRQYALAVGSPAVACQGDCLHGYCDGLLGQCRCDAGWTGSQCEDHCPGFPPCGQQGHCTLLAASENISVRRRCVCTAGYGGADCSQRICPACLNGGSCVEDPDNLTHELACQCPSTHGGPLCEERRCPSNCNGAGSCDVATGRCSCWLGATGISCNESADASEPLTNCVEVALVWGIQGPRTDNVSAPAFDPSFELLEAEAQMWLLDACSAARNITALQVRSEVPCWIEAWKEYVLAVGGTFPVRPRSLASQALTAFFHQPQADAFQRDLGTVGDNYTGHAVFALVRFFVNAPQNGGASRLQLVRGAWDDFLSGLNREAPSSAGAALMVSHAWTSADMEESILSNTGQSFCLSMGIAVLCVVLFSRNLVIGLFVLLTMLMEVCPLFGFLFGVMGYEFGAIEAVGAVIFVGMSVDYCLHLAHGYHSASRESRTDKLQTTLVNLGPSIVGGAITTAAGTSFLLPCRIVLFVKLGTMLVANTVLSLLFTFIFLAPLLAVAGPLHGSFSLAWSNRYTRQEDELFGAALGFEDRNSTRTHTSILRKSGRQARTTKVQSDHREVVIGPSRPGQPVRPKTSVRITRFSKASRRTHAGAAQKGSSSV